MVSAAERYTQMFYQWEERGRGWMVYDFPVELEPPFEPLLYIQSQHEEQTYFDNSRHESLLDGLKREVKSLFNKTSAPEQEEPPSFTPEFSYPERPVPFEDDSLLYTYIIEVPRNYQPKSEEEEQLLNLLANASSIIGYEIVAGAEAIHFQWTCREADKDHLLAQMHTFLPKIAISEKDPFDFGFLDSVPVAIADMGLSEEFMRPLATIFSPDSFMGITAAMEQLWEHETAVVQVLYQGCINVWAREVLANVVDNNGGSFFMDAPDMPALAREKCQSLLFGAVVRIAVQGENESRSEKLAHDLINALITSSRSAHNSLMPLSNEGLSFKDHLTSLFNRTSHRLGMLLNSKELLNFIHVPSAAVGSAKLSRQAVKTVSAPKSLSTGKYLLGVNTHLGQERKVLLTDQHRLRHTHVIGSTGVGKSTLLTHLFLQDIAAGNGCAILDPHGDTVADIIERLPKERLRDVLLLDPSDFEYPVGFNLLQAETEVEKIVLSSDLVETFRARSTSWGDTMTAVLANAIDAFLESEKTGSLLELRKFLVDEAFRKQWLQQVNDPAIQSYWQYDFPQLRKGTIAPLLTRLDTFLRPKVIRNMMAQKSGVDFNEALKEQKILLVKLSQGLIGEDNSYLLGTLILSKLYQAAQARQNLSKADRSPFYLYIDEFHHFITPSMAAILSGARKYGLGLVLAHQELAQVMYEDQRVGNSLISNPGVRVCFRLGMQDAQKLEAGFQHFESSDLQNLGIGQALARVERNEWSFNVAFASLAEPGKNDNYQTILNLARTDYAVPREEVEARINEVLRLRTARKEQASQSPNVESEVKDDKVLSTQEVIAESDSDLDEAAKAFVEQTEKQREMREHRYLQEYLKRMAEQRGFKVELEAACGKNDRIDLVALRDSLKIACEIAVTNTVEYEVKNIQKCLKAGYEHVCLVSKDEKHRNRIRQEIRAICKDEEMDKVRFTDPAGFVGLLDSLALAGSTKEIRVKGYRVKTQFSGELDEAGNKAIKNVLGKTIRKKKT